MRTSVFQDRGLPQGKSLQDVAPSAARISAVDIDASTGLPINRLVGWFMMNSQHGQLPFVIRLQALGESRRVVDDQNAVET
jgi:hypothetical protein